MKKTKIFITAAVTVMMIFVLTACVSSTAATIDVGGEAIPTVYSVVGEKEITGSGSGVSTSEGATASITYKVLTVDEANAYVEALRQSGYLVTSNTGYDIQLAAEASQAGKIIIVNMRFTEGGPTEIDYQVIEGTVTPNE